MYEGHSYIREKNVLTSINQQHHQLFFFYSEEAMRDEKDAERLIDFCLLRAEGDTTSCSGSHSGGSLRYSTPQAPLTELC